MIKVDSMKNQRIRRILGNMTDYTIFLKWLMDSEQKSKKGRDSIDVGEEDAVCNFLYDNMGRLNVKEPEFTGDTRKAVWESIYSETLLRKKKIRRKWLIYCSSSAAMIALFVCGSLFFRNTNLSDFSSVMTGERLPSSNVCLVLSSGKIIEIEESKPQLLYSVSGEMKISTEKTLEKEDVPVDAPVSAMNRLVVPYGKSTFLLLSDSTRVWVNSGTTLVYPSVFDPKERLVYVDGEVFIEVAKNEQVPFVVRTSQMDILVHGTSFNVSAYKNDDEQSVVLLTGSVSVKTVEAKTAETLKPDHQFSYNSVSGGSAIHEVDTSDYVSWRYGFLRFEDAHLSEVLKKMERYYNIQLDYDTDTMEKIIVSGKLNLKDAVEDVLDLIAITAPILYSKNENGIKIDIKP